MERIKKHLLKKRALHFWVNGMMLILLGVCFVILLTFSRISMQNLLDQEIVNQQAILKLNVDNINGNLAALQSYLFQTFSNSVEITAIETSNDRNDVFMAVQSITRSLQKIVGWNESLEFLFFYSPDSKDKTFFNVNSQWSSSTQQTELGNQVKEYIDTQLAQNIYPGRGYFMTTIQESGYVVRFYKVRNSYLGMCLFGETVLAPLEELMDQNTSLAFISDLDGHIISRTGDFSESIDIAKSGEILKIDGQQYLQMNYLSLEGDFFVGTWTDVSVISRHLQWMRNLMIIFVVAFLAFIALISILIHQSLFRPIMEMDKGMKQVENGEWDMIVKGNSRILEYDNMIANFNQMVSRIKDLKIENYEKEISAQKTYLQYLQLQVNPHFYLNALNIIYSLAQIGNCALIQEMTMSLVEYSRYMFREPGSLVTVQQEMEHVDNYMKIQKMRFPDRLDFRPNISSEIEEALIPPFIIQSFVENSIKYAVNFEQRNEMIVHGNIKEIDDELYVQIEIRDNGEGYSQEILELIQSEDVPETTGTYRVGIRNVKQRLKLVFGERAKLILENDDGAVTKMLIPLTWQEEEDDE